MTRRRSLTAALIGLAVLGMLAAANSFIYRSASLTPPEATPSSSSSDIQVVEPPCDPGPLTLVVRPNATSVVLRSFSGTNDRPAFALVTTTVVIDQAALAALILGLDGLPPYPCGTMSCPSDDGSRYQLDFNYVDGPIEELTLNKGGCRAVYFRGKSSPVATALPAPVLMATLEALTGASS